MQTKKSEKSNLELRAFRVAGSNAMKFLIALSLIAVFLLPVSRAQEANNKPEQAPATPKTVVNAAPRRRFVPPPELCAA